jgi:hypothetical protein
MMMAPASPVSEKGLQLRAFFVVPPGKSSRRGSMASLHAFISER